MKLNTWIHLQKIRNISIESSTSQKITNIKNGKASKNDNRTGQGFVQVQS